MLFDHPRRQRIQQTKGGWRLGNYLRNISFRDSSQFILHSCTMQITRAGHTKWNIRQGTPYILYFGHKIFSQQTNLLSHWPNHDRVGVMDAFCVEFHQ